ncbi:MAG: response regulator transcription factor [Oscillospiraceae bacterium]|nr:response regulator transcription factor [Oscillospiraceae bacterium]
MKKKIYLLSINPALAKWLSDKLKTSPSGIPGANELLAAIDDLTCGESQSVVLEMEGDAAASASTEIICGDLCILPLSRKVVRDGMEIFLTPREFDILLLLAKNRGEVFSKEKIYQAVWEKQYLLDDNNIMAFIRKIRKKIEPRPDAPRYILTIWGAGYKFNDQL